LRVLGFGFRVSCFVFRVSGSGFRVEVFGTTSCFLAFLRCPRRLPNILRFRARGSALRAAGDLTDAFELGVLSGDLTGDLSDA